MIYQYFNDNNNINDKKIKFKNLFLLIKRNESKKIRADDDEIIIKIRIMMIIFHNDDALL